MFKNSSKTKLDFDSGFKPLKVVPDGPSSKNIIELDLIFESDIVFGECFPNQINFGLNLFPKQGFYNFITTNKSISTLEFLDLFSESELNEIFLFITKRAMEIARFTSQRISASKRNQYQSNCRKIRITSIQRFPFLFLKIQTDPRYFSRNSQSYKSKLLFRRSGIQNRSKQSLRIRNGRTWSPCRQIT